MARDRISPSFTLTTAAAPPMVFMRSRSSSFLAPALAASTPLARAASTFAWKSMSMVSATVPPGCGSMVYSSLVIFPFWSVVMARVPSRPRSQDSKASSTPSFPTCSLS